MYETQNNMPLPLSYLLIESLCQICCIVSIKYKQIRVVLKIFDRTKIACTQTFRLNWSRNRRGNKWHVPIPSNFDYWKWENTWPICILAEDSHYNAFMPNFGKVVLWHFTSTIFRVSCKVPYQVFNSFHFPIVKAYWNSCITCLWLQQHSCEMYLMLHILVTFIRYLKRGIKLAF